MLLTVNNNCNNSFVDGNQAAMNPWMPCSNELPITSRRLTLNKHKHTNTVCLIFTATTQAMLWKQKEQAFTNEMSTVSTHCSEFTASNSSFLHPLTAQAYVRYV